MSSELHIPNTQGDPIHGLSLGSIDITTTILSTWIFMALLFVIVAFFSIAAKTNKLPRLRTAGIDLIRRLDLYFTALLWEKKMARKFLWLIGGFFMFIFLGNLFGLILDLVWIVSPATIHYIRPINSDLNTTLVMALTVILVAQATGIAVKGFFHHFGHYLCNFSGHSVAEKAVSFFIGWLHFAGEFIRIGSLSMRLFLNIFVGAILISVAVYVGSMIPSFGTGAGSIITLPFWFFELLVAFLQAYIFMTLSGLYLKESLHTEAH